MTNYPVVRYKSSPAGGNAEFRTLRNGLFADAAQSVGLGTAREIRRGNYPNKVSKWVGATGRRLFTSCRNILAQSLNDGVTWGTAHSVTGGDASSNSNSSNMCMVTGSNNQPYLVTGIRNSIGGGNLTLRFDGTSWLQESVFGADNPLLHAYQSKVFARGVLSGGVATASLVIYDPVTRAFSTANLPTALPANALGVFFSLNKRLFFAQMVTSGVALFEFVLGVWVTIADPFIPYIHNPNGSIAASLGAVKLDANKVLIFGGGNNGPGFGLECALVQIAAGAPSQVRVTDPVVPPFLRGPSAVGVPQDYALIGFDDNAETPGSPRHYMWFDPSCDVSGSVLSLFEVIDEATQLQIVGTTQITNEYGVPGFGGGHLVHTPGELSIQIVDQNRDAQGLRILYRCTGDPGVANKIASFRYVNSFGTPVGVCTLVAGSEVGGGTVVGNTVTGVDADPAIVHEVVWDFLADGVPDGVYLHDQAFLAQP